MAGGFTLLTPDRGREARAADRKRFFSGTRPGAIRAAATPVPVESRA